MQENFPRFSDLDLLKADNDFLKMKLMLERGASFTTAKKEEAIPPEIENQFLRQVIAFEEAFQDNRQVKIFDRIGQPTWLRPVAEIDDSEMENEWKSLSSHLFKHGITLGACNPAVTKRELYRFATEELFNCGMVDINVPGMIYGFIYDEFYPDPAFENCECAKSNWISWLFESDLSNIPGCYREEGLRMEDKYPLTRGELLEWARGYRNNYDSFRNLQIYDTRTECGINRCTVTGEYNVEAVYDDLVIELKGKWQTDFVLNEELDVWEIVSVRGGFSEP